MNDILSEMRQIPHFMALVKKIRESRPDLPKFNTTKDNTEEWKYISAKQEGIDLALKILGE